VNPDARAIVTYTPESGLNRPVALLREMWDDLPVARQLAWRLMLRDLRAQYRQSILGFAWAFLPAMATAIGFSLANRAQVLNIGETDLPYPVYVLLSMVLWQSFVASMNGPLTAIASAKAMISRVKFPRESIILAKLGEELFNLCVKLVPVSLALIWFRVPIAPTIVLAPLGLMALMGFGAMIGALLTPMGVMYQDIGRGMTLVAGGWMLLTPVVYPLPGPGTFGTIVRLNPVTPLLLTTRELATTGNLSMPMGFVAVVGLMALAALPVWVVFRLAMPYAIERVTS
jgi:lipopolysaccharide transport system permease protein